MAASEMQVSVAALPKVAGVRRSIRVGFHAGPLIEADGDVFGDTVNTAARMAGLAKGDQIIALEDIGWAILNTNEFLFQH